MLNNTHMLTTKNVVDDLLSYVVHRMISTLSVLSHFFVKYPLPFIGSGCGQLKNSER